MDVVGLLLLAGTAQKLRVREQHDNGDHTAASERALLCHEFDVDAGSD